MTHKLAFEKHFPHPPDKVWRALTDGDALAAWLMPNDFEPVLGRTFHFRYQRADCAEEDGEVLVEIEQISPPHRMVWLWRNTEHGDVTRVTFTLEKSGDGTLLRLDHADISSTANAASMEPLSDPCPGGMT